MALPPLTSSDAEALARDKINAGLTQADAVKLQADALAGRTGTLEALLAALQIQLAPYIDLVGGAPDRPGDARTLFTRVMTGSPKARPAIDKGTIADGGELGQVLRISGADTDPGLGYIDVAPRRAYYMRPGRAYLVQHHFKRFQNPSDPLQHAVELRFQNLNSNFGQVSNVRLGDVYQPMEQDGAYFVDTFIGKAGAPGTLSYIVPPTSAYGVPFFRIYGNGHQTDLGLVRLYDVSDALAGGADIASILFRVKKLEDGQLAGVTYASSWADLASRVGKVAGAGARTPDSDTGTHVDPVTGATVSNAGNFLWSVAPQGWQWVSVTDARQSADFVGEVITPTTLANAPTLELAFRDPATKKLTVLSPADARSFIEAIMIGPPTYFFRASGRFGTTPTTLIAAPLDGAKITRARIKNESKDGQYIAFAIGGEVAALNTEGSYTYAAGGGEILVDLPPGNVSIVASRSDTPVTCHIWSTTNVDPNSSLRAARHLARYQGGNLSDARRKAIGDYYNYFANDGWLDLCLGGGYIWVGRAPGNFDALLDWANPSRTFGRVILDGAAFPETSVAGTVFNGSNAIDTGITPASSTVARHAFLGVADATLQSAAKNAAGNASLKLNINRAVNSTGITSGGAAIVVSGVQPGGLQGFRRDGPSLRFYRNNNLKTDLTQALAEGANLGSTSTYIGALHTPSGLVQGYTGTLEMQLFAVNGLPTDDQINRLYAAHTAFVAALGA